MYRYYVVMKFVLKVKKLYLDIQFLLTGSFVIHMILHFFSILTASLIENYIFYKKIIFYYIWSFKNVMKEPNAKPLLFNSEILETANMDNNILLNLLVYRKYFVSIVYFIVSILRCESYWISVGLTAMTRPKVEFC